jgi:hypothetical protein
VLNPLLYQYQITISPNRKRGGKTLNLPSIWTERTERSNSVCIVCVVLRRASVTSFVRVCKASSLLIRTEQNRTV